MKWSVIVLDVRNGETYNTNVSGSRRRAFHVARCWPFLQTSMLAIALPEGIREPIKKALSTLGSRRVRP